MTRRRRHTAAGREFQSTSPVWGMTDRYNACPIFKDISIHIPRVGDDAGAVVRRCGLVISIHIPRVGDDRKDVRPSERSISFQSTSPVWGMTQSILIAGQVSPISIHIPRVGDDMRLHVRTQNVDISIHIPRVGDDAISDGTANTIGTFQSTSPVWGMTAGKMGYTGSPIYFNPHPPCGG